MAELAPPPESLEPGWRPDPYGRFDYRFWDGREWTAHVSTGGAQQSDPIPRLDQPTQARSTLSPEMERGLALEQRGDVDGAVAIYRAVIEARDPDAAFAAFAFAGVMERQGDLVRAEAANKYAAKFGAVAVAGPALTSLARLRTLAGDADGAAAIFRRAVALGHPDESPRAAANLGTYLEDTGDRAGAIEAYQFAIRSGHPDHGLRATVNYGQLLQKAGDLTGAAEQFRIAIAAKHLEETPRALLLMGYLCQDAGDVAAARRAFEATARTAHPLRAPSALVALGGIKMEEDLPGAAADFQRATELCTDRADKGRAALLLGVARRDMGDRTGAREALQLAKSLGNPETAQEAATQLIRLAAPLPAEHRAAHTAASQPPPAKHGRFGKAKKGTPCPICSEELSKGGSNFAHWDTHVMEIPPGAGVASGQFTFICVCGPANMKWPKESGAAAGLALHMQQRHDIPL